MSDSSQNIANKYSYDPFGKVVNQVEAVAQPFKFVGQYGVMTEPNGFYYMRARYYDPEVGRFISEDPIGFEGGDVNLMAYVGNQPVNGIDPLGLTWSSNWNFFLDWAGGGGSNNRSYGPNTVETQEMQNSSGASALRNAFYAGGGKSQYDLSYGSGQAAWDTVINPATADLEKEGR
jgi:RHS repeat-associated protein